MDELGQQAAAVVEALGRLRVANGFDVHPFVEGRPLVLGGTTIEHDRGLDGHSDADVIAHAVTDAVLGAAGKEDIGAWFSSDDPLLAGADSMQLLAQVLAAVRDEGCALVNVDVVVLAQVPRLSPHRAAIRANLAAVLGMPEARVTVRATTTDHLGFVGRQEGIAALATCLLVR